MHRCSLALWARDGVDDNSYDDLNLESALVSEDRDWMSQVSVVTTHVLTGVR